MTPLEVRVTQLATEIRMVLTGTLDETSALPTVEVEDRNTIVIDWQNLDHLNSRGVGRWVFWVGEFHDRNPRCEVVYVNCPQIVVHQMNTIRGFCPDYIHVKSFAVPFYSDNLDEAQFVLYEEGVHFNVSNGNVEFNHPTDVKATRTGDPLELDVVPEQYFAFFTRWK